MHHRPRHRAHIAAHTRPMTLDLPPISRSAPPRGHTPRNLTLFAHQPPTAAASGAEAVPLGSGDASSHLPALPCAGRGRGVTNPLRRGTAAAGRGLLPSYRRLLLGRPLPNRPSDALGIQGGVDCLPHPPLTHRRRRGWWTGRREGCGVWGGLSGPGPAVRAARKAARGTRPRSGHSGVSSSGPRPLRA